MLTYLSIYQRNKDRFYQKKKGWIDENVNDESCLLKFEKLQIARICLFFFFMILTVVQGIWEKNNY